MRTVESFSIYAKDNNLEGTVQINEELAKRKLDAARVINVSRILVRSGYAIVTVYHTSGD